jgi:hypothetical protein
VLYVSQQVQPKVAMLKDWGGLWHKKEVTLVVEGEMRACMGREARIAQW